MNVPLTLLRIEMAINETLAELEESAKRALMERKELLRRLSPDDIVDRLTPNEKRVPKHIGTLTPRDLTRMLQDIVANETGCEDLWRHEPITEAQMDEIMSRIINLLSKQRALMVTEGL